jgi:hypothetical protein
MKKNFKTLNEEINRMKSLFDEDRLYGNIKEDKIISEQYRFFSNIADAFKVTLKSFDQLDTFTKFINMEINSIDDIIKHVDEFDDMWRIILPNVKNWDALKNNLKKLKTLQGNGKLKNITEDVWIKQVLPGFPERGGMRDMVNDMWRIANGKNPYLPQKVETRIVKTDPNTGALVVGVKSDKGVTVFKNEKGEVVMVEKGDENIKPEDLNPEVDDNTNIKPEYEDVDWEEVPESTTLDDLTDTTVRGTEENVERIWEETRKVAEEETKKGNKVVFTITGEGDDGIKAAEEMLRILKQGGESEDKIVDDLVEEGLKNGDIKPDEVTNAKGFWKKFFTEWPTRMWVNPLAINEGIWKQNFSWWDRSKEYGAKVSFRTLVLIPSTVFLATSTYKSKKQNRSYIQGYIADAAIWYKTIVDWFKKIEVAKPVIAGLKDAIRTLSNQKIDPDVIHKNLINGASSSITGATTGESFITCDDIINGKDEDIIKRSFKNIKISESARVSEILNKTSPGVLDNDSINEIKNKCTEYMDLLIDQGMLDESNFKNLVQKTRESCLMKIEQETEEEEITNKEYEVEVVDVPGGVE